MSQGIYEQTIKNNGHIIDHFLTNRFRGEKSAWNAGTDARNDGRFWQLSNMASGGRKSPDNSQRNLVSGGRKSPDNLARCASYQGTYIPRSPIHLGGHTARHPGLAEFLSD